MSFGFKLKYIKLFWISRERKLKVIGIFILSVDVDQDIQNLACEMFAFLVEKILIPSTNLNF